MTAANDEIRAWARAQGEQVSSRGNLSGKLKERFYTAFPDKRPPGSVALLPSPDDDWGTDDGWDVIGLAEPEPEPQPLPGPRTYEAVPDEPQAPTVDSGPAHGGKEWRAKTKRDAPSSGKTPRKVSVTVRNDISAKIGLPLEMAGRVWQARDPLCGGTFLEQRPAISDALTDIVCDSPDLVAWFTGGAGKYMTWFNFVMACWPVAVMYGSHHVWHTVEEMPADAQQPDYGSYAA